MESPIQLQGSEISAIAPLDRPPRSKDNEFDDSSLRDQEILEQKKAPLPHLSAQWNWAPCAVRGDADVVKIATDISIESYSLFSQIPFEDWLKHALGYEVDSVDDLFFQHRYMSVRLCSFLRRNPKELDGFLKVKEVRVSTLGWISPI